MCYVVGISAGAADRDVDLDGAIEVGSKSSVDFTLAQARVEENDTPGGS